jgi:4-amino-4-deoxychorismate lyase
VLSRGCEASPNDPVTGVVTVVPLGESTLAARRGIHVATIPLGRPARAMGEAPWLLGGVKTLSYAVNMAAAREAERRGVDDVVFTSTEGFALEAPRAALIWRVGDALGTTCHDDTGVLASVTQSAVFAGAEADGVAASYELISVDDLRATDGAWLVSSGRLSAPILSLDGHDMAHDDAWTARLRTWCGQP